MEKCWPNTGFEEESEHKTMEENQMEEELFSLNQLSMITGYSTRMLRNFIKSGMLQGQLIDEKWYFDYAQMESFFADPYVRAGLQTKRNSLVNHFLQDTQKPNDQICSILDFSASEDEQADIQSWFVDRINGDPEGEMQFFYTRQQRAIRIIITGPAKKVVEMLNDFYGRR